ncbi:MAG: POTRA domain-containing protein, partial [Bacteroidota bacterium]|nr:POTRA domain-containing protein [Bacteroidota bacterium]
MPLAGAQTLPPLAFAVKGNAHVPEKELVVFLRSKGLVVYRQGMDDAVRNALGDLYTAKGFAFSHIDTLSFHPSLDSSSWVCAVTLREGPLVKLGELSIVGETGIPRADLVRAMALTRDEPFSAGILQEGILRMLALFERRGYPFASVTVRDIAVTSDTEGSARADITLEIRDGGLRTIDEITVEGNTSTRTHVIARETRIAPGEIFDAEKVNEIRRSVERLGFFRSVSEPTFYVRGDRGGILLKVIEANTNTFDGILGYQPPIGLADKGYLTGAVRLSLRNLFGTGRKFDARWERASRTVTELELHYTEPWLFGYPFTVGGGFFQRQQDSAYVRRAVDGTASYLAGRDWSVSATVRSVAVIPAANTTIAGLASSTTLSAGLALLIDGRDDMYNPSSGIWVRNA